MEIGGRLGVLRGDLAGEGDSSEVKGAWMHREVGQPCSILQISLRYDERLYASSQSAAISLAISLVNVTHRIQARCVGC